jgi:glutamate-1-semialdehyde aminotransferase
MVVPAPPSTHGRSLARSEALWARAGRVIPLGTQTLSKSPSQFVDGVSPKYLVRGRGSRVWDPDGNEYVDWPMALGAILIGYDEPAVTAAVIEQVREGTTFTLMHPLEVEVAELIVDLVPCAEQVRFAKNGGDATNAAIRAARALTGREHVLATGYHGYHDWYIASTERHAGIPAHDRTLTVPVPFGDLGALEAALRARPGQVAAVIVEVPAVLPPPGYLQAALDAAHRHGALFVLDEIITGFRYALGGIQEVYGVRPDLCCLGKGLANGYPLSAVAGTAEAMAAFEEIFFSMTFSGETVSLAAARATLSLLREEPVHQTIAEVGTALRAGIAVLARGCSFDVRLSGSPPRSALAFAAGPDDPPSDLLRGLFLQECHKRGVLFGVPVFPTYRHGETELAQTLAAVEAAFARMEAALVAGACERHLEGVAPGSVFRSH